MKVLEGLWGKSKACSPSCQVEYLSGSYLVASWTEGGRLRLRTAGQPCRRSLVSWPCAAPCSSLQTLWILLWVGWHSPVPMLAPHRWTSERPEDWMGQKGEAPWWPYWPLRRGRDPAGPRAESHHDAEPHCDAAGGPKPELMLAAALRQINLCFLIIWSQVFPYTTENRRNKAVPKYASNCAFSIVGSPRSDSHAVNLSRSVSASCGIILWTHDVIITCLSYFSSSYSIASGPFGNSNFYVLA